MLQGWKPERQQCPASLHFSILPHHNANVDAMLETLAQAANKVRVSVLALRKTPIIHHAIHL